MKFESLSVANLRAIRRFEVNELGAFIMIAGQNGCGKSCVFDAIRLLKSVYGGYAANEYQQWFGEFQINLSDPSAIRKLFRDQDKPIQIEATLSFSDAEQVFLHGNADSLVQPIAWQQVTGQPVDYWTFSRIAVATQLRTNQAELQAASRRLADEVRHAVLDRPSHRLAILISPTGEIATADCKVAEVAFQAYAPDRLGVIEYHSASRTYSRQQVGGINLDVRAFEDQQRQQRLYNAQNKYQNVKTELASSYLRALIAGESGDGDSEDDLNETMKELFNTFFPDKTYLGVRPQPRGALEFPVQLTTGETHDIDELSSGEKEILYGYLKLRNSTPPGSIILLDEPELHLNPSLLQGFTDFYYRHLGVAQGNQLWLVTHSDTLLRQAVGNVSYRVFQMTPATAPEAPENQAVEVLADDDVERVTIELVGDLASYRPHGKVVLLEGLTETGFDVTVVQRLFPAFARRVNLVGGGSKRRVRDLHAVLKEAADSAGLRNRFFSIVDKDTERALGLEPGTSEFSWDVYHIENYLLHPRAIRRACISVSGADQFESDDDVLRALREIADGILDRLVLQLLQADLNGELLSAVAVGAPSDSTDPARDIWPSLEGSLERVSRVGRELTRDALGARADAYRNHLRGSLADEEWMREFPGRLILNEFAKSGLERSVDASLFRNVILDKMVELQVEPPSMRAILEEIAAR
ncbi:MAG: hypothetical protein NVS3B21_32770 [Acidimicrobiales bacterium]